MQRSPVKLFFRRAMLGFAVVSCTSSTTPETETFSFSTTITIQDVKPTQFTVALSTKNDAISDTTYSAFCGSEFRVLNTNDSTGTPVWTSASRGLECGGSNRITLHAGQSSTESLVTTAKEVLGASHPDGEYRVEIVALIAGKKRTLNAGRVLITK